MIDPPHPSPRPLPLPSSPAITAIPRLHTPPAWALEAVDEADNGPAGLHARLRLAGLTAGAPRAEAGRASPPPADAPVANAQLPVTGDGVPAGDGIAVAAERSELLLPTPVPVGMARLFELEEHLGQLPGVQWVEVSLRDDGRVLVRVDVTPGAEHVVRLFLAQAADALEREHRRL